MRASLLTRGPRPRTHKQKPAWNRRVCIPAGSRKYDVAIESFPYLADFRKPRFLPRAKCALGKPLPSGLRCNLGGKFALDFRRSPCPFRFFEPAILRALARLARQYRRSGAVRAALPQASRSSMACCAALGSRDAPTGAAGGIIGRTALAALYALLF